MVGRREGNYDGRRQRQAGVGPSSNQAIADAIRDHFDQRIAEVVRKEAIADKLAQEWEEHYELTSTKEELIEAGGEGFEDEAQTLTLQIQFKEDRIRQLAQRLGKHRDSDKSPPGSNDDHFLFDKEFKRFCAGKNLS